MSRNRKSQGRSVGARGRGAPDEGALLARARGGDRVAFEALYRAYYPRLTRFLAEVTQRQALVEEVLNDTMLVVWCKARTYNGRSKVSTWIFGIAWRKALKALKRLDEPVDFEPDEHISPDRGADGALLQQQLHALLGRVMGGLSAEQRAVVELTYYHGYACQEIAEIMDCPVDTVKTRMFYARRRLRTLLGNRLEVGAWRSE